MRLSQFGRQVYAVAVTLTPAATGTWTASFDGGATWEEGVDQQDGSYGWLVAGASNTGGTPVFQFGANSNTVTPLLRLDTGQEQIVVRGPDINIV
jgi:hypothetical protein